MPPHSQGKQREGQEIQGHLHHSDHEYPSTRGRQFPAMPSIEPQSERRDIDPGKDRELQPSAGCDMLPKTDYQRRRTADDQQPTDDLTPADVALFHEGTEKFSPFLTGLFGIYLRKRLGILVGAIQRVDRAFLGLGRHWNRRAGRGGHRRSMWIGDRRLLKRPLKRPLGRLFDRLFGHVCRHLFRHVCRHLFGRYLRKVRRWFGK